MGFWQRLSQPKTVEDPPLRCSFCNKHQDDVRKLIAGPNVFICDECIQVCNDIVADDELRKVPPQTAQHERPEPEPVAEEVSGRIVSCTLCNLAMAAEEALIVRERGFLCPGCVGEIEASLASRGHA